MLNKSRRLLRTASARRSVLAARQRRLKGDLEGAQLMAQRAVQKMSTEVGLSAGPSHGEYVVMLHVLADVHLSSMDLTAAVSCLDHAVDVIENAGGGLITSASAVMSDTLVRRGTARRLQANYDGAWDDLVGALKMVDSDLPKCAALNAIGILAKDQRDYPRAAAYYSEALHIAQSLYGPESAMLATIMHNMAGLEYDCNQLTISEGFARRAISLRSSTGHADDQAALLGDQSVLAAIHGRQGREIEAERMFRELAAAWGDLRGPLHYEVACCCDHLGVLLRRRGAIFEAGEQYRQALYIKRKLLGESHPETLDLKRELDRLDPFGN